MEFSQKEEATYDLLVNTKVGEIKQLKYEMCRPKKKGKSVLKKEKEREEKEEEQDMVVGGCVPEYATPKPRIQNYALPRDHSEPLPLPPDNNDDLYDVPYSNQASAEEQNVGHQLTTNDPAGPVPVPRVPVVPESPGGPSPPKGVSLPIPRRTLPPPRRLPAPHRKAPPPPTTLSTPAPTGTNIQTSSSPPAASKNYEPWSWRQQNYESWTPLFKPTSSNPVVATTDVGPPPSGPPPKPPTQALAPSMPCASAPSPRPPSHLNITAFAPAPGLVQPSQRQPSSQSVSFSSTSTPSEQHPLPLPPPVLPCPERPVLPCPIQTPQKPAIQHGVQQNSNPPPPAAVQNPVSISQQLSTSHATLSLPSSASSMPLSVSSSSSTSTSSLQQPNYEPWHWRRKLKEEEGEEEVGDFGKHLLTRSITSYSSNSFSSLPYSRFTVEVSFPPRLPPPPSEAAYSSPPTLMMSRFVNLGSLKKRFYLGQMDQQIWVSGVVSNFYK